MCIKFAIKIVKDFLGDCVWSVWHALVNKLAAVNNCAAFFRRKNGWALHFANALLFVATYD